MVLKLKILIKLQTKQYGSLKVSDFFIPREKKSHLNFKKYANILQKIN